MTAHASKAWVRGTVRRPLRVVVPAVVMAVMTVAVVGALVAADSMDRLFLADARAEWGEVDVEVTSSVGAFLSESGARAVALEARDLTPQAAPRVVLPAVATSGGRREAQAQLLGLGAEEQLMATPLMVLEGRGTITDVLTLQPDEVVLNERLADRLGAGIGDRVDLLAVVPEIRHPEPVLATPEVTPPATTQLALTVVGIVADSGVADLHRAPSALVRRDLLQIQIGADGLVTALHLAAQAPGRDPAVAITRAVEPVTRQLGMVAEEVKADAADLARDEGGQFRGILLTLAVLAVGAAAVAVMNLLLASGHDRARELALLRSVGLRAGPAGRLQVVEALAVAPLGVVPGLLAGVVVGGKVADTLSRRFAAIGAGRGREQVELALTVRPGTLLVAAAVVALAAVVAGALAGRALAAASLEEVLRGRASATAAPLGRGRPVAVGLAGTLVLGMGLPGGGGADLLRHAGVTLLLVTGWLWWRRQVPDRVAVDRRAALGLLAWSVGGALLLADFSQGYETGFGILTVAAVAAIAAVTVLAVWSLRAVVGRLLGRRTGRLVAATRLGAATAAAAPSRSATTVAVLAITVFMVAALSVLGGATALDTARQSGGFDVIVTTAAPLDEASLRQVPGVTRAVALDAPVIGETAYAVEDELERETTVRTPVRLYPATQSFIDAQSYGLADALPGYDDAADALRAVRADGDKAVVDRAGRPEGAQLGDDVVIELPAGTRRYELIAVLDTYLLQGAVLPESELAGLVPTVGPTVGLVAGDGRAPAALAGELDRRLGALGADVRTVAQAAAELVEVNRAFTDLFALMLVFGLAVVIIAEAALVVREARARRGELAALHAIGADPGLVAGSLVAERALLSVLAVLVGLVVGVSVLRLLFAAGFSDLAFILAPGRLAALVVAVVVLHIGASWVAARASTGGDVVTRLHDLG